jgi:uncharacterized protein HemY
VRSIWPSARLKTELQLMRHRNALRLRLSRAVRRGDSQLASELKQALANEEALDADEFAKLRRAR